MGGLPPGGGCAWSRGVGLLLGGVPGLGGLPPGGVPGLGGRGYPSMH